MKTDMRGRLDESKQFEALLDLKAKVSSYLWTESVIAAGSPSEK